MIRGFLSGVFWGGIASAVVAAVLSQWTDLPPEAARAPDATELEVPGGSEFDQAKPDATPVVPSTDADPDAPGPTGLAEPDAGSGNAAPSPDTTPANAPQTAEDAPSLTSPDAGDSDVVARAPTADPQQPPTPEIGDAPLAPGIAATPRLNTESAALPETPEAEPETAEEEPIEEAALAPETVEPETPEVEEPEPEPQPAPEAEQPEAEEPEVAPETSEGGDAPNVGEAPAIRMPVPEITDRAPNVTTNRLPRIGVTNEEPEAEAAAVTPEAEGAMAQNAIPFDNLDGKPLMAVVLYDDGSGNVSPDVAESLPFPVSFAIDAAQPDSGARAARYRENGYEVVMTLGLPEGAEARDIEVAFQSAFVAMPDAVAVLDQQDDGFGARRLTARHVVEILAESGHGLVTFDRGLNAAQQIAQREGVPGGSVFRVIDEDGASAEVMRRYLDRSAFRAQQDGQVIVVGTLTPETVEGLMAWAMEDLSANMLIAPVSAVLRVSE